MSAVNLTNVTVLSNPAPFLSPFRFEISYECLLPLKDGRVRLAGMEWNWRDLDFKSIPFPCSVRHRIWQGWDLKSTAAFEIPYMRDFEILLYGPGFEIQNSRILDANRVAPSLSD
ncbi:hypothetical protein OSB04_021505 [Centaurea solstitialis]|uniref:Uncharacterized protein n=1 Tax=Centaurea solstitialis TaxID=347529 RepID=A0AA38W4Z8_9ASTR|nr:hypothetical protein OSB04_021505 [Centaurea solstitialis]